MDEAVQVFMDYAAGFEETYKDDDWSRLERFFAEDASYEVRSGPLACLLEGPEAIFAGMKKSVDGLDRQCSERKLSLLQAPQVKETDQGHEISVDWHVAYQYKDAPRAGFDGRSVATVSNGVITTLRDEYTDEEMGKFGQWMQEYGAGLSGAYV